MEDKEYKDKEIEFEGEINDKAKKYLYKKYKISLLITFFYFFIILGASGPLFMFYLERLVTSKLLSWIYYLVVAIVCLLFYLIRIMLGRKYIKKEYPVNIKINYVGAIDDIILNIKNKRKSKYSKPKKSFMLKDVRRVIDYGEWYHILLINRSGGYFGNLFFCQKDLLVKGTIQDFEMIFDGMIVKKAIK